MQVQFSVESADGTTVFHLVGILRIPAQRKALHVFEDIATTSWVATTVAPGVYLLDFSVRAGTGQYKVVVRSKAARGWKRVKVFPPLFDTDKADVGLIAEFRL